jgi:hypothetical protein
MNENGNEPIAHSTHEKLKETAVQGLPALFEIRDEGGSTRAIQARIQDLYARDGLEYLRTSEGRQIRLDHVQAVNGEPVRYERRRGN